MPNHLGNPKGILELLEYLDFPVERFSFLVILFL